MYSASLLRTPELSLRWIPVWRRNLLVWRKLALASVLGNIADPLLYMLALGYGIGAFVPEIGGMKYIAFIGTGMVCQSAMFTSSFEAMYSAFSRMHVQRTWEAIINAPLSLDDVVFAEWIWAATKSVMLRRPMPTASRCKSTGRGPDLCRVGDGERGGSEPRLIRGNAARSAHDHCFG